MTPTLIRDVSILTLDENDRFIERGFLLLSGDRIEQVGEGDPPPFAGVVRRIDGSGKLAVPGLINAHGHSQSATLPCLRYPAHGLHCFPPGSSRCARATRACPSR